MNFKQFFYHDNNYCHYFEHHPLSSLQEKRNYYIEMFYHPSINEYNAALHDSSFQKSSDRFARLLQLVVQAIVTEFPYTVENHYNIVQESISEGRRQLSFDLKRPNGIYNWEIFFHIPFTIACRLSQQKKFAEAQQWFHYIFNPLASLSLNDGEQYDEASKYWNVLPLHKLGKPWSNIDTLKLLSFSGMSDEQYQSIMEWIQRSTSELAKDPFQPHRIARLYRGGGVYQKAVVMKYLDNLLDWGDYLFAQDTIESINEAAHLYILAAKILGPRPRLVPKSPRRSSENDSEVTGQV